MDQRTAIQIANMASKEIPVSQAIFVAEKITATQWAVKTYEYSREGKLRAEGAYYTVPVALRTVLSYKQ